jgi:hypothetical protein
MKRIIGALAMALAVVALPQSAAAKDAKRPERPNPEALFNRLDANHDGFITRDEIPAAMPERLKNLLREADVNHDGKIAKRELLAAINARHPGPRPGGPGAQPARPGPQAVHPGPQPNAGHPFPGGPGPRPYGFGPMPGPGPQPNVHGPMPGPGPQPNVHGPMPGPGPGPNVPGPRPEARAPVNTNGTGTLVVNGTLIINGGTVIINGGTLVVGGPAGALKGAAPHGGAMGKPKGRVAPLPMLNARVLFSRLDTNKDGKLSFGEFAVGVSHLQRFLATRMGELKRPVADGIRSFREKMGQFKGQFGRPGMGTMGQHPGMMGTMGMQPGMGPMGPHRGMGPMGQHPGMGPMGQHPGMAQMGMMRSFGGHPGPAVGNVRVRVTMGADGDKHGMKKPEVCKCGVKKGEPCKCPVKKHEVCKCGAKKGEPCKCPMKKHEVCKCGAKKGEPCKCPVKKAEAQKPAVYHGMHAEQPGHRTIEARLTALETQQAEILKLLKSVTQRDQHHDRGGR